MNILLSVLLTCSPVYEVGTCLKETLSEAILYINKIEDCRYYYTVHQHGAVFDENMSVVEFEKDKNRIKCQEEE